MKMKDMLNRIASGVHAGVDTRAESVALLQEAVGKVFFEHRRQGSVCLLLRLRGE